jgi:eukaryotic-like serine/threonine-protein kinase
VGNTGGVKDLEGELELRLPLGEMLLRLGWIGGAELAHALERQRRTGGRIGSNLVRTGLLTADQVAQALGSQHGVMPATDVLLESATSSALGALPAAMCEELGVLPLRLEPGRLHLGLLDAQQLTLVDEIARRAGLATVVPYALPEISFEKYFARYFRARPAAAGSMDVTERPSGSIAIVNRPPLDDSNETIPAESLLLDGLLAGAACPVAAESREATPKPGAASSFEIVVALDDAAVTAEPARATLASPPREKAPAARSRFAASVLTLLPPEVRPFGRYNLICRLGSGGMANLFLAELTGPGGFQKLAAIKQIHQHLSDDQEFIRLFIDEARLAARISHPNVAQVAELGRFQSSYFIAMEYVAGENLMGILRRTGVPLTLGARIVADAAAGLHAAHELRDAKGQLLHVVHRDVSPENILVSYDGAVKVLDFGIARARGGLHTSQGRVVRGKSSYIAPEQICGDPVDRRVDVFSLGVVLYELTTRTRLFCAETDAESLSRVLKGPVWPPSELVAGYPAQLEQVVLRALERDQQKRFQTAGQLQRALEEFIASTGTPVLQSEVATLMATTFADNIEKKKALLRQLEESF